MVGIILCSILGLKRLEIQLLEEEKTIWPILTNNLELTLTVLTFGGKRRTFLLSKGHLSTKLKVGDKFVPRAKDWNKMTKGIARVSTYLLCRPVGVFFAPLA